jgi:hypothetical protein
MTIHEMIPIVSSWLTPACDRCGPAVWTVQSKSNSFWFRDAIFILRIPVDRQVNPALINYAGRVPSPSRFGTMSIQRNSAAFPGAADC